MNDTNTTTEPNAGQIISDMQAAGVIPGPAPAPGRHMAALEYGLVGACIGMAISGATLILCRLVGL